MHIYRPESAVPAASNVAGEMKGAAMIDNTVANYVIEYAVAELDTDDEVDELFDFLTTTFTEEIKNETIGGASVDEEFVDNYSAELNTTGSKIYVS